MTNAVIKGKISGVLVIFKPFDAVIEALNINCNVIHYYLNIQLIILLISCIPYIYVISYASTSL